MSGFTRRLQRAVIPVFGSYKPDASNTGVPAGTTLVVNNGDIIITTDGTVIDGLDVFGQIIVRAANVTIRRSKIRGTGVDAKSQTAATAMIDCDSTSCVGCVIEDVELAADTPCPQLAGVIGHDFVVRRANIYHVTDGVDIQDIHKQSAYAYVYGCYIHDLAWITPDPNHSGDAGGSKTHNDCIQPQGNSDWEIIGNNLQGFVDLSVGSGSDYYSFPGYNSPYGSGYDMPYANSAIQTNQNTGFGILANVKINHNWADGGGECFNIAASNANTAMTIDEMVGNRFGRNQRTLSSAKRCIEYDNTYTTLTTLSGNVYEDDDSAVTIYSSG